MELPKKIFDDTFVFDNEALDAVAAKDLTIPDPTGVAARTISIFSPKLGEPEVRQ